MDTHILIIYDYVTPAYKAGGPTQSLSNMIGSLGQSLSLNLIATNRDLDGTILDLAADQWLDFPGAEGGVKVWYASKGHCDVGHLIGAGDTLFINSVFSHHFNYPALLRGKARRKIISPRGMLDPGSLSQKSWKKHLYLAYWKLRGLHKLCEWHATTEQEKTNIQNVFGKKAKVWVVPNFPRIVPYQRVQKRSDVLHLVTIAVISPMKNHHLILQALKMVKETIVYNIYGPVKDKDYWAECQDVIKTLPSNIKVHYHGDLTPGQVEQALQGQDVAILPSKSENFGHSICEALTAGKPVITSHFTPWNRLKENKSGINVSIDNANEISDAISLFASMDTSEFTEWSKCSRGFAFNSIDIENTKKGYLEMFA